MRAYGVLTRFGLLKFGGEYVKREYGAYIIFPHKYLVTRFTKSEFKREVVELDIRIIKKGTKT